MPVNTGDVLRVYTEAGPKQSRKYQPGTWRTEGVCFCYNYMQTA